jgi:NitT/TauT family transport system substrate-binding protein
MGIITSGDAAKNGIGTMNDSRIKQNLDFLAGNQLVDPAKVKIADTYKLDMIKGIKVLP